MKLSLVFIHSWTTSWEPLTASWHSGRSWTNKQEKFIEQNRFMKQSGSGNVFFQVEVNLFTLTLRCLGLKRNTIATDSSLTLLSITGACLSPKVKSTKMGKVIVAPKEENPTSISSPAWRWNHQHQITDNVLSPGDTPQHQPETAALWSSLLELGFPLLHPEFITSRISACICQSQKGASVFLIGSILFTQSDIVGYKCMDFASPYSWTWITARNIVPAEMSERERSGGADSSSVKR